MFPGRVLLVVLGVATLTQGAVKLSDFVTPCSLKDPDLDGCLATQANKLVPHLVAGVKEWGVVPMDPLFVPLMHLQRNAASSLGISIKVINSTQYGWKDMKIEKITMDPKNFSFNVTWLFPKYQMFGDSETSGRILLLPISGTGAANLTFYDARVDLTLKCDEEVKGGKKYLKVSDYKVNVSIKDLVLNIDNLFNNKKLSDAMNKIMNDNALEIFDEVKPNIEDIFAEIAVSVMRGMFAKIQLKDLFADVE